MNGLSVGTISAEQVNSEAMQSYLRYIFQASQIATRYLKECEDAYTDYIRGLQGTNNQLVELLTSAHHSYVAALGNAWASNPAQERCRKNYELCIQAVNKVLSPAREEQYAEHEREYGKFSTSFKAALAASDSGKKSDAVQDYLLALNRIWGRGGEVDQAVKAANAYVGDLKEVQAAGQAATISAYHDYVDTLKSAWQKSKLTETAEESFKTYAERLRSAWEAFKKADEDASSRAVQEIQKAIEPPADTK
jgi:hypothetical protein